MLATVIVTTYNWKKALQAVLNGLRAQCNKNFEVIIADDGSKEDTKSLIEDIKKTFPVPLIHIHQEDQGFRAAACRNKAILKATGKYIIFLDGDCIPLPTFIDNHLTLCQEGYFVAGNRVLLNKNFTDEVLEKQLPIHQWSFFKWIIAKLKGQCNRILPLLNLPIPRKLILKKWQGAKGCNFAAWKSDLVKVNGWDESFEGWGFEDSDIIVRLIKSEIYRIDGRFKIPIIHLWHKENDRGNIKQNWNKLQQVIKSNNTIADLGLST